MDISSYRVASLIQNSVLVLYLDENFVLYLSWIFKSNSATPTADATAANKTCIRDGSLNQGTVTATASSKPILIQFEDIWWKYWSN